MKVAGSNPVYCMLWLVYSGARAGRSINGEDAGSSPAHTHMTNNPEYMREYHKKHYAEHRQKYIDQAAARRRAFKEEIWELKRQPCMDCKQIFNPWQMHFDHRDNDRNGATPISHLVNMNKRTKALEEIEKCDLVCANCHADRTYQRQLASFV